MLLATERLLSGVVYYLPLLCLLSCMFAFTFVYFLGIANIHFLSIVNHHQFKFGIVTLPDSIQKTACSCRLLYVVCHFT
jgi:hypothetical protein